MKAISTQHNTDAIERKHTWPMVRLGDVCEVFTDGDWIESKDQAKSGIRLIQTGNIGVGEYIDKTNKSKFISELTFERLKCTEIYPGDVLISRLPEPVGRSCVLPLLNQRMITAVDCSIVRFKSLILPAFFVAYSQAFEYEVQILSYLTGSTRQRISRGNLAKIEIPLPPLPVQREIVARLERELAAVEKMKKGFEALAETAKAEFKAELKEVFEELKSGGAGSGTCGTNGTHGTVETRRLGEVCEVFRGDYITRKTEQPGSIPVVLGGREPGYYINRSNHEGPCLVVSRSGASAGYVSYWDEPIFITDGFGIEPGVGVEARFLHYQMLVNGGFSSGQDGAAIPHVTGGIVRDYKILLPSLSVQREVVARLDLAKARAEKLESKAREGVVVCETMRKAILKEAFE